MGQPVKVFPDLRLEPRQWPMEICRAALQRTTEHLTTTGFEHDGTKLRDLPNLRARLAEMSVRTREARA